MARSPLVFQILRQGNLEATVTTDREIIRIGRLPTAHIRLDDPEIARLHAVVEVNGDHPPTLIDLGSNRGTRLNGALVGKAKLRPGDELEIGPFIVRLEGASPKVGKPANEQLVRLRELLYSDASPEVWKSLVTLVDHTDADERDLVVDYAVGHLEGWPDALRVLPGGWLHQSLPADDPRARMVRTANIQIASTSHQNLSNLARAGLRDLTVWVSGRRQVDDTPIQLPHLKSLNVEFGRDPAEDHVAFRFLACLDAREVEEATITHTRRALRPPAHVEALVWPRLTRLTLTNVNLSAAYGRAFPTSRLETLTVRTSTEPRFIDALFSEPMPRLRELTMEVRDSEACTLANLDAPELVSLDLRGTRLTGETVARLAGAPAWRTIRAANLTNCGLASSDVTLLAVAHAPSRLERLNLADNLLSGEMPHFTQATWEHLSHLDLRDTRAARLAAAIFDAPHRFPALQHLDLSGCRIDGEVLLTLSGHLPPRLRYLDLSRNELEAEDVLRLLSLPGIARLETLDLTGAELASVALTECDRRKPPGVRVIHPELRGAALTDDEVSDVQGMTPSGMLGMVWKRLFGGS